MSSPCSILWTKQVGPDVLHRKTRRVVDLIYFTWTRTPDSTQREEGSSPRQMPFKCTVRPHENTMSVNHITYNFLHAAYISKSILQATVGNRVWFSYKLYEYALKFAFFFNYGKHCVLWVFFFLQPQYLCKINSAKKKDWFILNFKPCLICVQSLIILHLSSYLGQNFLHTLPMNQQGLTARLWALLKKIHFKN